MKIGISLACFYPEHPENTINTARSLGFNIAELFVNTISELDTSYIGDFSAACERAGLEIYSLHPFTSALENYIFFSRYDRRIDDAKRFYARYCDAAKALGARVINLHGDRGIGKTDLAEYIECLKPIAELSARYGVCFSMENVFYNSVNSPSVAEKLVRELGDGISFTFDIKQAHKGGSDPYELCDAMGKNIVNFHINDYDENHLCMLPGRGVVDYRRMFSTLEKNGYKGPALIEVYRSDYDKNEELAAAAEYLRSIAAEK